MNNTSISIYNNINDINDINNSDIYGDTLLVIFIFIISTILAVIFIISFLFYIFN